jgi:hypothetical protein
MELFAGQDGDAIIEFTFKYLILCTVVIYSPIITKSCRTFGHTL